MAKRNARANRRATIADPIRLEARRLLSITPAWVGQSSSDYVGTQAGDGPDGIYDDELTVGNIDIPTTTVVDPSTGNSTKTTYSLSHIDITDSSFQNSLGEWETLTAGVGGEGDTDGYAPAWMIPATDGTGQISSAQIYINPEINVRNLSNLSPLNLGSNSNLIINLHDQLNVTANYVETVTVTYSNGQPPSTSTSNFTDTQPTAVSSAPDGQPLVSAGVTASPPQYTLNGLAVSGWSQDNSTNFGWVNFTVAALNASTISAAVLSDPAGGSWVKGATGTLVDSYNATNNSTVFSFPPTRDEDGATMSLLIDYNNDATPSLVEFKGGYSDPGLTAPTGNDAVDTLSPSGDMNRVMDLTNLNTALKGTDGVIQLGPASNSTVGQYYLDGPLTITRPVTIEAAPGATITVSFLENSESPSQSWTDAIEIDSDQIKLASFQIDFLSSIPWNISLNYPRAVIGDGTFLNAGGSAEFYNSTYTKHYLVGTTLEDLTIAGPPAPPNNDPSAQGSTTVEFYRSGAGDPIQLNSPIDTTTLLSVVDGRIDDNTIVGGPVDINGGPWNVDDNDFQGAVAGTVSQTAINVYDYYTAATDVTIEGNHAHQVNAPGSVGRLYRFFAITGFSGSESYNLTVEDNRVDGGVGLLPGDVGSSYDQSSGTYSASNDHDNSPEVILDENYSYNFEGKPLYVWGSSSNPDNNPINGRILVIPPPQGDGFIHSGSVVSILSGRDPGHESDAGAGGDATGEWFLVDQVLATTSSYVVLLLNQSLPLDPNPQYGYDIEVSPGQVNPTFDDNTINLSGTFSDGIVLAGNDYGTRIIGNHLTGGDEMERTGTSNLAEGDAFEIRSTSSNFGSREFYLPSFGTIIDDNVILNSLGGGNFYLAPTQFSAADKTFITATVTRNVWQWNDNFVTAGTPFLDSPPPPGQYNPPLSYPYPSVQNTDTDGQGHPVHGAIGSSTQNPPDLPLLKTLTIGTFNGHINNDDSVTIQTQNWTLNNSYTVGQTPNTAGYFEGMNGYVDPMEDIVSVEGNSYQILDHVTGLPESNYAFPVGYEPPKTVIVAGIVNANPYSGPIDDDTTLVLQQGASPTLSIAAGGTSGTIKDGFVVDTGYFGPGNTSGTTTYSTTNTIDTSAVASPDPQSIYQNERDTGVISNPPAGLYFSYTIPNLTVGAMYSVRLDFTEFVYDGPNLRKFDVSINGVTVLQGFDIFAAAGGFNKAVSETFDAVPDSNRNITIMFTNDVGGAKVDGVEVTSLATNPLSIAAGGTSGTVKDGFVVDSGYIGTGNNSSGTPTATASTISYIDTTGVVNPAPQSIYQNSRNTGTSTKGVSFTYTIPNLTTTTPYYVRLEFAEYTDTAVGQRVFDVAINGVAVPSLQGFDILAAAGLANKAISEGFYTTPNSQGQITITFTNEVGAAQINGIEITPLGAFTAIMVGQDGSNRVGSALGHNSSGYDIPSAPDVFQDEHVVLENLDRVLPAGV